MAKKANPRIKKSGAVAGSKKEDKEGVKALIEAKKAKAAAAAAASGDVVEEKPKWAPKVKEADKEEKKDKGPAKEAQAAPQPPPPQQQRQKERQREPAAAGAAGPASTPKEPRPDGEAGEEEDEEESEGELDYFGENEFVPEPKKVIITANYELESWTGKRPLTLLNEFCQRQQWHRPAVHVMPEGQAFKCKIILAKLDPSDNSTKTIYTCDNRLYKTDNEARHFAAVFALFRVARDKSMHLVLPPGYRDYWRDLEKEFNDNPRLKGRPVPKDPFDVPTREQIQKERDLKRKQRERLREEKNKKVLQPVHMSEAARQYVENAIRATFDYSKKKKGQKSDVDIDGLIASVKALGFLEPHIREAATYCGSREDVLDWLCLHVPEEDLPVKFRPNPPSIDTFSHDQASLAREYQARRLAAWGFRREDCLRALVGNGDNEMLALRSLVDELTGEAFPIEGSKEPDTTARMEEIEALASIYADSFVHEREADHHRLEIKVTPDGIKGDSKLHIIIPHASAYPHEPPIVMVRCLSIPAYVRMSVIKALNLHARTIIGDAMVFPLVSLLEELIVQMVKSPPPLANLDSAAKKRSGEDEEQGDIVDDASEQDASSVASSSEGKRGGRRGGRGGEKSAEQRSKQLLEAAEKLKGDPEYQKMKATRDKLPAFAFRDKIIAAVESNQVVVISGQTGCGKTTQVPQFILEDLIAKGKGGACKIICTQPRRLSAIGVAERVAAERLEAIGKTIGYSIRLEQKASDDTRLLFCTTGILLRQLQMDESLAGVTHIFVDEVHERSVDSDVVLAIMTDVLRKRKDLRLVLMSATVDSDRFSKYFRGAPVFEIPGFTFPVKELYLEDLVEKIGFLPFGKTITALSRASGARKMDGEEYDEDAENGERVDEDEEDATPTAHAPLPPNYMETLNDMLENKRLGIPYEFIREIVRFIINSGEDKGAILIFLPGSAEIKKAITRLEELRRDHSIKEDLLLLPLHSALTSSEQAKIFKRTSARQRKIIVSTNIAETSITIDDVTHVIDSAKLKEVQYDGAGGISSLVEVWGSKASLRQRQGRAGRVQAGTCYKLLTRGKFEALPSHHTPEILRVPLEQLCLRILSMEKRDVAGFLSTFLDAPDASSVRTAMDVLQALNAVDKKGLLTALGRHMSALPMDVHISKFLLFGAILGCLDPVLTMAAAMSYRSPFQTPFEKREEAKRARLQFDVENSDHLSLVKAYDAWDRLSGGRGEERRWCDANFLNSITLNEIRELRQQYQSILQDIGFGGEECNKYSHEVKVIKAALCAGLYPRVVKVVPPQSTYMQVHQGAIKKRGNASDIKLFPKAPGRVFLHPSSLLFHVGDYQDLHLIYHEKVQTSKVFLRDATMIGPYPLLLFGGELTVQHESGTIAVDGWIEFEAPGRVAVLVNELRDGLDRLLAQKIDNPSLSIFSSPITDAITKLLITDGQLAK